MFLLSGPDYNIIIMKEELNLRILSPRSLYEFLTLREVVYLYTLLRTRRSVVF